MMDAAALTAQNPPETGMKLAVIVASSGRAEEIAQLLLALSRQTRLADAVILSVTSQADLPDYLPPGVDIIIGPAGLPAQRNRGLERVLPGAGIVVFYDDDFLPACDSLAQIGQFFNAHPHIAGATGHVLADGINSPGLDYAPAQQILNAYEKAVKPPFAIENFLCAYGCNMAFRVSAIGARRFDEMLPRYAWQEDMDFAGQVSASGPVIRTNVFAGVHRGVKKGRGQGLDLGFSQIVNPLYLLRKGTMTTRKALTLISRNLAANHIKVFRPEPYVDRWGRLRGNWLGLLHVCGGRLNPAAIPSMRRGASPPIHRG